MTDKAIIETFDNWLEEYALYVEPLDYESKVLDCRAAFKAGVEYGLADTRREIEWISTSDRLPEKPGLKDYEYVDCLIVVNGEVLQRPWNCEHLCWDDIHYDDFEFEPTKPTHWMPLPSQPKECSHDFVLIEGNPVIKGTEICTKCNELRGAQPTKG